MPENNMPKDLKPSTSSALAGLSGLADPNAREAVCPLCGRYMAVFPPDNYCNTDECGEAALDYAKAHPELKAIVKAGDMTILLLSKLHRHADPVMPESLKPAAVDTGYCEYAGCETFAKPRDSLCNEHRRKNPKAANNANKHREVLGNKIKGFDRVKAAK